MFVNNVNNNLRNFEYPLLFSSTRVYARLWLFTNNYLTNIPIFLTASLTIINDTCDQSFRNLVIEPSIDLQSNEGFIMGKQKKKVKANSGNNKNKRGNEKNDNSRKEEIRDKSDNQNEDKNNSRKNINGDKENNKKDTDDKDENRKNSDDKDQDDKNQDEDEEKEDKKTKDDNKQEDESRNDRELKKEDDLDGAKKLEKEVIDEKIDTVNEAELEEKKAAEIEVEEKKATETEVEEKKATEIEVAVEEKYAKEKIIEEPTKVEKTKMVQFQRTFLQPDSSLGWPNLLKMFGPRNLLSKGRKQEEVASKENVVTNSSDVAPRSSLDSAHTSKSNFELDFAETSNQLGTSKNNLQPER